MKRLEDNLHQAVVNYLKLQFPKVIFRTDFAAGIKMTKGQAVKHKSLQKSRAYPDIFISEMRGGKGGLFLELKKDRDSVYKKDGTLRQNEHISEQKDMLCLLESKGYKARFACGFDEAKSIIDEYLK